MKIIKTSQMLSINRTAKFFPKEKVDEIVQQYQQGDPEWKYTAVHDPSGKSPWARIAIHDEDGEFVSYVTA